MPTMTHTPFSETISSHTMAVAEPKRWRNWLIIGLIVVLLGPFVAAVGVIVLLTLVSALGSSIADEESAGVQANLVAASSHAIVDPVTPATMIDYHGQMFHLVFVGGSESTGDLNEYVPVGETLDRWTKMIAVRTQPVDVTPVEFAHVVIAELKKRDPKTPHGLKTLDDGESCCVDFAIWQDDVAEFNLFVYRQSDDGKGLASLQYAERAYGDDIQPFFAALDGRVSDLQTQACTFAVPTLVSTQKFQ